MKRILLIQDAASGLGTPPPNTPPAKTPAPSPAPAPAPSPSPSPAPSPTPTPAPSDDPFERPKSGAPAPKPAAPAAPAGDEDFEKLPPKDLRERVKGLNAEKKSWSQKEQEWQNKIAAAEAKGKDTTVLTEQMENMRKEFERVSGELRAVKQEASPQFKEKYDKPFNLSAERCRQQITELTVEGEDGARRPAKWEDFAEIYSLPVGKAIERAEQLFGKASQFVIQWREKLLDMDNTRRVALDEERAQYKQRQAEEEAGVVRERETVNKLWAETNERLSKSTYSIDPADKDLAEARDHALSVFDAPINTSDRNEFYKQKVLKDAHIRQKVGKLAVQTALLERANAKVAELEATLAELRGNRPGSVIRPTGQQPPAGDDDTSENWAKEALKHVTG